MRSLSRSVPRDDESVTNEVREAAMDSELSLGGCPLLHTLPYHMARKLRRLVVSGDITATVWHLAAVPLIWLHHSLIFSSKSGYFSVVTARLTAP